MRLALTAPTAVAPDKPAGSEEAASTTRRCEPPWAAICACKSGRGYDFVFDACANGHPLKCLTIIDEFTRECLAIDVAGSISVANPLGLACLLNLSTHTKVSNAD